MIFLSCAEKAFIEEFGLSYLAFLYLMRVFSNKYEKTINIPEYIDG